VYAHAVASGGSDTSSGRRPATSGTDGPDALGPPEGAAPLLLVHGTCGEERAAEAFAALADHTPGSWTLHLPEARAEAALRAHPAAAPLRERLAGGPDPRHAPGGELGMLEALLAGSTRSDLVLIEAGVIVTPGWLPRLAAAAWGDSVSASASAVPASGRPRAARDDGLAPVPPPALASPAWGAVYVRRDALDLVLGGDLGRPEGATVTEVLTTALAVPGLVHRLAPDVVVHVERDGDEALERIDETDWREPGVTRALQLARASRDRLSVLIDGRALIRPMSGTGVHLTSLARALAETGEADVSVLLPQRVHDTVRPFVSALADRVRLCDPASLLEVRPSIFHRPYQLGSRGELEDGAHLGERFVLTHQDMIMDRTREYFEAEETWRSFRRLTAAAFRAADQVGFFSRHAAADAAADGALAPEKVSVVPLGVDHLPGTRGPGAGPAPRRLAELAGAPFLLVLGHAYRHKNRLFALRLLARLLATGRWDIKLVLAGPHPDIGSSVPAERDYLGHHPELRPRVLDLGPVSEAEKGWLYDAARLVLFPSLYEGFGLVPFEAAAHHTPAVWARRGPMREFLPHEGAVLEGWDVDACSREVSDLLGDGKRARRLVEATRQAASQLTWERTAQGYLEVYRRALAAPVTSGPSPDAAAHSVGLDEWETHLITLYRQRPAFRAAADAVVRSGGAVRRLGGRLSRRTR
jgi:glycosyltransferase involved in cell wall biosynthesis